MDTSLETRLKDFRKRKQLSIPKIAKATGISRENLYKWEKGTKPSNLNDYNKLIAYMDSADQIPDDIFTDPRAEYKKGLNKPPRSLLVSIFLSLEEDTQLYEDENAVPGSIITIKGRPALIAYRNELPLIGEVDGLIPITGDSMEPKYKGGSWIAIKKLKFTRIINGGYDYYVIDKNEKGMLRKVKPSGENNSIILQPENENISTITRSLDDILAIFSVEAVVMKQSV